jgi:hypothetical protein
MEVWLKMREPHDGYEVSNQGAIRKKINSSRPERKKPFWYARPFHSKGCLRVAINNGKKFTVSRLVYDTFVGDLEDGLVIAHRNGKYDDNRPENLVQVPQVENIAHKREHGTWQACEKHPAALSGHSFKKAEAVRNLLMTARRVPSGSLGRGERKRIAAECGVDLEFITTVQKGGWTHGSIHRH